MGQQPAVVRATREAGTVVAGSAESDIGVADMMDADAGAERASEPQSGQGADTVVDMVVDMRVDGKPTVEAPEAGLEELSRRRFLAVQRQEVGRHPPPRQLALTAREPEQAPQQA